MFFVSTTPQEYRSPLTGRIALFFATELRLEEPVAFRFQLVLWDKLQRCRVRAIPESGGSRAVIEDVSQVSIGIS